MSHLEVLLQPIGVSWGYVSEDTIAASTRRFLGVLISFRKFLQEW